MSAKGVHECGRCHRMRSEKYLRRVIAWPFAVYVCYAATTCKVQARKSG